MLLSLALAHAPEPGVLRLSSDAEGCWEADFEAPPNAALELQLPGCSDRVASFGAAELLVLVDGAPTAVLSPERPVLHLAPSSLAWQGPLLALGLAACFPGRRRWLALVGLLAGQALPLALPWLASLGLVVLGRALLREGARFPLWTGLALGLALGFHPTVAGLEALLLAIPVAWPRRPAGWLLGVLGAAAVLA